MCEYFKAAECDQSSAQFSGDVQMEETVTTRGIKAQVSQRKVET